MFGGLSTLWIFVGLGIVAVLCLMGMVARLYRKAGPHEALVVYGYRKEMRIRIGRGTVIWPVVESCRMPVEMNGNHCFGPRRKRGTQGHWVKAKRSGLNVYKHRYRTNYPDCCDGRSGSM